MQKKTQSLLFDTPKVDDQINTKSVSYRYDTKEYPIEVLLQKYEKKDIEIPVYQRQLVWEAREKSRFIESLFLGVPIPPLFGAILNDTGNIELIDGSQRLRTLKEFCSNEFILTGLEKLDSMNGLSFSDLSKARQKKFNVISLRFHVIMDSSDLNIRADIFDRINTGGKKLTPSEIRRGALSGAFYNFVIECSKLEAFLILTPITKSELLRGEAEELVLRFFAYSEKYLSFDHDVTIFLNDYVKEKNIVFDKNGMERSFAMVLGFAKKIFPKNGFAKTPNAKTTPRVRFEALAVGIYLALQQDPNLSSNVKLDWMNSAEFKTMTTSEASNNQGKLIKRVEFVRDCLLGKTKIEDLSYESSNLGL